MLGAIIGDIIGSPYEAQEKNIKTKDFPLFSSRSKVTDDSVLTCAVAEAFLAHLKAPKIVDLRHALIDNLKEFGNCFQNVPYGKSFRRWMSDYLEKHPCNSFSNCSAMRFSPVGCLFDSLEKAQKSPTITPGGIKGAQVVAAGN
jgi:ADP-ribosylglycohydrolase